MNIATSSWVDCKLATPVDGVVVMTKVDDMNGSRNEQPLLYRNGMWWVPDGSMYVYYSPTHWQRSIWSRPR